MSRLLVAEAPALVAAIERVIEASDTAHIPAPKLTADERQPETVPEVGIYDGALDAVAPRKLSDVWEGKGDYDDPLVPKDAYEQELMLARLRKDPESEWHEKGLDDDAGSV